MKLYKFKKARGNHNIRSILSEYNLSINEVDEIMSRIDCDLYFYEEGLSSKKLSILGRLSIIPLCVVIIIMVLIVMPIKWILTGRYRFNNEKPSWFFNWINKF